MIKKILKICLFILIGILQVILLPYFAIYGVWPNVILIIAIIFIANDLISDAYLLVFIGGIILDLTGNLRMGSNTLILLLLILVSQFIIKKYFPAQNILLVIVAIFFASLLFSLLNFLFLAQMPNYLIFYEAIYAAGLGLILYLAINAKIVQKSPLIKIKAQ